jgi:hypothetical protein
MKIQTHKIIFLFFICLCGTKQYAQVSELPFRDITKVPEKYTTESIFARMIHGLGFRFYWATDGLRTEDLTYRFSKDTRTNEETIDHIMGLSKVMLNAVQKIPNTRSAEDPSSLPFDVKRKMTLDNLKAISDSLLVGSVKVQDVKMLSKTKEGTLRETPFWNILNGPLEDAVWHVGQVVALRRASGNPFNPKVSVLMGKLND